MKGLSVHFTLTAICCNCNFGVVNHLKEGEVSTYEAIRKRFIRDRVKLGWDFRRGLCPGCRRIKDE